MNEIADISRRRCSVYPDRPAVAQCPECRNYFSRECIAEHEGRFLCAACIESLGNEEGAEKKPLRLPFAPAIQLAAAAVFVWMMYFTIARLLILVPSEFHEGTIWDK